jgi:hypothetical protein
MAILKMGQRENTRMATNKMTLNKTGSFRVFRIFYEFVTVSFSIVGISIFVNFVLSSSRNCFS